MLDLFSNLGLGFQVVFQFVPWSPQPIKPTAILLLGASAPSTLAGINQGAANAAVPVRTNCRLEMHFINQRLCKIEPTLAHDSGQARDTALLAAACSDLRL